MTLPVKLIGCALVLLSGGGYAVSASRYEKKKLSVLDGWMDLIFFIRSQIDCYLTPLSEILQNADPSLLRACMGNGNSEDLPTLQQASGTYLGEEARRLLNSFVREIGSSYREEQVKRCDYYLAALRDIREKQREELPARLRVCTAISLCASFGIAILLW